MSIYAPIPITKEMENNFKPTRLAIKRLFGIYYFCKSTNKDIIKYQGSGVVWGKRIKKYGKENIETLWVSDWYHSPYQIQEVALHFSRENKIVESDMWANLRPENGLDGGFMMPASIKKMLDTKVKNNTTNSNPEITKKMVETKIKNGKLNSNTYESISKGLETKRKNGTLSHTSERRKSISNGRKNGKLSGDHTKEHSANISRSLLGHTKTNVLVSRLIDKKVMTLCSFTRWCNQSYTRPKVIGPYKKDVCRLSDRKEMTLGKFIQYLSRSKNTES